MTTSKLAIHGGEPVIGASATFPLRNSISESEIDAVVATMRTGILSQFLGTWSEDFMGGAKVREFEAQLAEYFGVRHALTVNSWTSGLVAAVGAIGIEPGDEVIVTPFTMAASATAILHWNGIPVFADIDPQTFCLDPAAVEALITPFTKAIMAVDIFGLPSASDALMNIAQRHSLKVITDSAQAPGAMDHGRFAGTITDIGGFSLNYHKHIHTGEGGVVVTNDDALAENVALIRNHAEAVVGPMGKTDLTNMIGHNFRMGEIEASIGIEQLGKLRQVVTSRQELAGFLSVALQDLPGLSVPLVPTGLTHAYYVYPITIDSDRLGVKRDTVAGALRAEGIPGLGEGYQNIHLLPTFQHRQAYGTAGYPWSAFPGRPSNGYAKGICPVAERLYDSDLITLSLCTLDFNLEDMNLIARAFKKVWANLDDLR